MKSSELRIGNYVKSNCHKGLITSIGGINQASLMLWCNALASYKIDEVSPIELSPEILEKAGFEYHYLSPSQQYFHCELIVINTYKKKDAFYYESQLCDVELKYLHQLQNLYFALTGQELNI